MASTIVRPVGDAFVASVKARGVWVVDILWALWRAIVVHVLRVAREDPTTADARGLGLGRVGAEATEDVTGH